MATLEYWVDGNWGGPYNGTEAEPYATVQDVGFGGTDNDIIVNVKRGSEQYFQGKWSVSNPASMHVRAYGEGPKPIIRCYWTSTDASVWSAHPTEANVWRFDTNSTVDTLDAKPVVVGLGSLDVQPSRRNVLDESREVWTNPGVPFNDQSFDTAGQWDNDGNSSGTRYLYIYSPSGNPVTVWGTIYYTSSFDQAIGYYANTVAPSSFIVEDIRFENCGMGVRASGSSNFSSLTAPIVRNCEFHRCYRGIYTSGALQPDGVQGLRIHDNVFTYAGQTGIYLSSLHRDVEIYNNVCFVSGHIESIGFLYMAGIDLNAGDILVRDNTCYDQIASHYWTEDGYAFYIDHGEDLGGGSVDWVNNKTYNSGGDTAIDGWPLFASGKGGGYTCNIGAPGSIVNFIGNYSENDNFGIRVVDVRLKNNIDARLYNNTIVNPGSNGFRVRLGTAATQEVTMKNNLLSSATTATAGINLNINFAGTLDEDYNIFGGFAAIYNEGSQALGANSVDTSITVAVKGGSDGFQDALGTGVTWWSAGNQPLDYDGIPFSSPPNIGNNLEDDPGYAVKLHAQPPKATPALAKTLKAKEI